MNTRTFHQTTARELRALYAGHERPPEGWQGVVMWHCEQAGDYGEAMSMALERAQTHLEELEFAEARRWIDHGLKLLDRLSYAERSACEMRAYALTVAVLEFEGKFREALGYAQLILRLAELDRNAEAQGRGYLTLGRVHRELGQLEFAESDLVQALKLAERHQMRELELEARFHLAKVHQLQGRHLEAFQQLDLTQKGLLTSGGEDRLARVYTGIGDIYRVLGSGEEALQLYHRALKVEIGTKNRLGQAMLYEKLALSHLEMNELYEAIECINEALRLRTDLDDKLGQARSHSILGTIQHHLHDYRLAQEHYEQARAIEAGLQNRRGLTISLSNLGDVARATRNYEQARAYYEEALKLSRGIGDQLGIARIHERLGDVYAEVGGMEVAREHWSQALQIRDEMGHYDESQALRERIARAYQSS